MVFHVAADYRLWTREPEEMFRSNVDGTRNLLERRGSAGVERVVYTSTVGCIGMPKDGLGDEETPVALEEMTGAVQAVEVSGRAGGARIRGEGFPVVIVNPTAPVGDHDFKPTPTGKIVVDFVRGAMPAFRRHGLERGGCARRGRGAFAALRARAGGRAVYFGVGESDAAADFWRSWRRSSGKPAPKMRVPYAVAYAAGVVSTAWAGITGKEPLAPLDGGADGAEENVGAARQGGAGTGIFAGSGGGGARAGGGMVPGEWLRC